MSDYQYAVVFEANNLSSEEIKKIGNYFKIKRQSGGGECGEVEKVGDNTYKISFLRKAAQDRVLSKTDHIINLSERGNLHIFLKRYDNKEEKKVLQHSTSDQQVSGDTHMQKVFKLDPYLLRYLKDNSKAKSDLEEQLSSMLSTFKLDMVTETVVVMREAVRTDQSDVQHKWEAKLDIVFSDLQDRYTIRFEMESTKLEILQKNSCLLSQNIKVYEENDLSVIVGEIKEVEKFLKVVDALQLQQQACKKISVSETRYALVKEQFTQEIKSKCSNIKVSQEQSGCLVLKGPKEEVNSSATKLQELLNGIQEKNIPILHSLKTFLSSSGAIQVLQTRFQQNLCSPVLLETTGFSSDLILLSLSTGALQEATTAIQRDLCVETVPLEKAEAESPGIDHLKKSLSPALQQANQGTSKLELSYQPGSGSDPRMKVQLVGYSTEVNKLKTIIQDYKENYAEHSSTVNLPLTELVDNFSELLSLLGVTSTDVTLTTTSLPVPCVHLSGPRCKVIDMKKKLLSSFSSLKWKKTSVDGPGVLQYFQEEGLSTRELLQSSCQVLITLKNNVQTDAATARNTAFASLPIIPASVSHPGCSVALKIVFGGLEDQQADVLVAPMLKTNLTSTNVGKCLLNKAQQFSSNFDAANGKCRITPGDVLEVDGTPLGCKKVFFIECVHWTGNTHNSEKALRCGLERALALCVQQAWHSIALPVIGPGVALAVPIQNATSILTGEIGTFCLAGSTGSLRTIQIVIMPNYPNSEEIYQAVNTGLNAIMVDHTGQAVFQSLRADIDDITIPVGQCQLHLIFGDISNETTDVVVNTTDFNDLQTDVCNDILTIAGAQVKAALTGVQVKQGDIFLTQPGNFPCKAIMHVCGENDTKVIKKLAQDILLKCEHHGHQSVAIPAICAGKGGLDARLVAQAILQGVKDATIQTNLNNIKRIHIILMKIHVFLEFKAMAQQIFGRLSQIYPAPLPFTPLRAASSSLSLHLSSLFQSLPDQHITADFLVLGLTDDNISRACQELNQAYKSHCSSHFVSQEELKHFTPAEIDNIMNNVTSMGIQISHHRPDVLEVSGLTKGINKFMQLIREALVRQVSIKEQDTIFSHVSWCILGLRGVWERLPREAHFQLENWNVAGEILDAQATKWTVNLKKLEAKAIGSKAVTKIKRLENLPDFFFPLYWDSMDTGEVLRVVPLHPSSAEYKAVKSGFKNTVSKTVIKIERIQSVNLRQAYEVHKKELQNKNGPVGVGEKVLYHGTTVDACTSIQRSNFNRSFAGQNATYYGLGTYFAVNASYSANPRYSVPSTDGTQFMFVALVLTGLYTQGKSDMRVPPPRSSLDNNDRYDSVVDNMQTPSMFVVFHDCQAYPDYLITFK